MKNVIHNYKTKKIIGLNKEMKQGIIKNIF